MLGLLGTVGSLFGLNPLGKAAKLAGGVALVVLLGLLLWGAKAAYDSSIIREHDNERAAIETEANRKADAKAATERRADDDRAAVEATQIERTISNATAKGHDPRAAYYECVRLQQAARRDGRGAPACP